MAVAHTVARLLHTDADQAAGEQDVLPPVTPPRERPLIGRELLPEVPFIFVTGAVGEEAAATLLRVGATDVVFKSGLSQLVPSVRRALVALAERRAEEMSTAALREKTRQLEGITATMARFIETGSWKESSAVLLSQALEQTDSALGFTGVLVDGPCLRVFVHSAIPWDALADRSFYEDAIRTYERIGYLEFRNFENLFGHVITTGASVLCNAPATDPRSKGCPPGHPALKCFLGVPFRKGGEVTGMIAVFISPFAHDMGDAPCADTVRAAYLAKPFAPLVLVQKIQELLGL